MEEKKRFFVQEGREGKGMKIIFPSNLSNFGKIYTLTKYIHLFIPKPFPPNPFPPVLLSKQGVSHPSKSLSFLSLHFFSIKTHSQTQTQTWTFLDLMFCTSRTLFLASPIEVMSFFLEIQLTRIFIVEIDVHYIKGCLFAMEL